MPGVAFDMVGTFFTLERPRRALHALGAPPFTLELWFAQALRDSFAVTLAGGYRPLAEVLEASLPRALMAVGVPADREQRGFVLRALEELEPARGAAESLETLRTQQWRVLALTNGGESSTRELLERAGLLDGFDAVLSADAVGKARPHPDAYAAARQRVGTVPRGAAVGDDELWLVTAHAWDVAGGVRAGLRVVWIRQPERELSEAVPEPELVADDLASAAEELVTVARAAVSEG